MAVKLSFEERKWLLKCYWKVQNVVEVERRWRVEFSTPPPTRVTITRIRDKFEVDGTVQDVLKGRCGSTPPPTRTRVTITRIRDKFEVDGTVQDVLKGRCGRKRSSTDNESAAAVMRVFQQSPRKRGTF
ncbi:hypothetical protein C0J52_21762 [Blattella germanica]|nr:hypothetical protein C0J52_21762 [Blattella germanica]